MMRRESSLAISVFWLVSSGLICSPVDLMHDHFSTMMSLLYMMSLFHLYSPLTSCKNSEKFFRAISEKTALPIITNNTDLIGPR